MLKRNQASSALEAFTKLWKDLFTSPIHLDSALSKQKPAHKGALAQAIQAILLRPVSLGESMGIPIMEGEPWSLTMEQLSEWRPALLMAERMIEGGGNISIMNRPASPGDFSPFLLSEIQSAFPNESALISFLSVVSETPPLSVRVNRGFKREKILSILRTGISVGTRAELSKISPLGITFSKYTNILQHPEYQQGAFEIQDEGSQYMALFSLWPSQFAGLLQKTPGPIPKAALDHVAAIPDSPDARIVIDACAGAGGKSLALGDLMKGKGRIFAYDTSATKLQALKRRASRAGIRNIQTKALQNGNEGEFLEKFKRTADVVLVDAPCSGWGVLRRNPDIKWRQQPEKLAQFPEIQLRILDQYSQLVAPGGSLIYGVCTFRPAETQGVVDQFIKVHPDFIKEEGGYLGPGPCDGFFMQRFRRA